MVELIEIPNYINGAFEVSDTSLIISDCHDNPMATIYSVSDLQLRKIKRSIQEVFLALKDIELEELFLLIEKIPDFYFKDNKKIEELALLSGSPISYLESVITLQKEWCRNIRFFYKFALSSLLDEQDVLGRLVSYHISSKGTIVAILPQNSDEEPLYVILQALLSRSPVVIRSSSNAPSSYCSLEVVHALNDAVSVLKLKQAEVFKNAVTVINLFHIEQKEEIFGKLFIENASLLFFGSETTLDKIKKLPSVQKYSCVVGMGSGLAISVVHSGDMKNIATEVLDSAIFNNGSECIATRIIYVDDSVYDDFTKLISEKAKEYGKSNVQANEMAIGHIKPGYQKKIIKAIEYFSKTSAIDVVASDGTTIQLVDVPLNIGVPEIPGITIFVKRFKDTKELLSGVNADLNVNALSRNIVTSIFTAEDSFFEEMVNCFPTYLLRKNKGTSSISPYIPHQGVFFLNSFINVKIIEK